ncbi:MAG TPA: hypothetical protein DCG75_13545 [Bacteroidales bacterium]|jgi:hypothetical protein|nr:hypothetical protein [Bacteroidales bacterium]
MKSQIGFKIRILSFSILISCIAYGLSAQEKHSNLLSLNTEIVRFKTLPKTKSESQNKLAILNHGEIVQEEQQLEVWMFNRAFLQIKHRFEWENEPLEEPREIEDWMKNIKIKRIGCVDIYSDFVEKDWMHEHNFFIL